MIMPLLLIQASMSAVPPPTSSQGQDVIGLFESMCVESALNSAKAHRLDTQPAIARPMTSDELTKIMPGGVATEGWIVRSPHDAWSALWFAPSKRTCGVTVRAADASGMETALADRIKLFYGAMGLQVVQRPDETLTESSVTVHRASWTIDIGTHQVAVIASFGDKPIGAHQHLMTFTMLH